MLKDMMDNRPDISKALQASIVTTPMISAESFLTSPAFKELEVLDLDECRREWEALQVPVPQALATQVVRQDQVMRHW